EEYEERDGVKLGGRFLLAKALLPMLKEAHGQVVFVNSTAGLVAGAENGLYAATKHALHSITGSIRDHVNSYGIRVISVFPGRTATLMQQAIHRLEGQSYEAAELVQTGDGPEMIVGALALSRPAEVTDNVARHMQYTGYPS